MRSASTRASGLESAGRLCASTAASCRASRGRLLAHASPGKAWLNHDRRAAAPWVASPGELTRVGIAIGRLCAPEEQVDSLPPQQVVVAALELPKRVLVETRLEVKYVGAVVDDVADHLHDRGTQAVGPGAAERQLDVAATQHDRRRHHAGHPRAGGMLVEAERIQVLFAEHVVEVKPGPGREHPRTRAV